MGSDRVVELIAPAKLTVSLRVAGVRGDGYHLIDAEMVTLDLHDRIVMRLIEAGSESSLRMTGPHALEPAPDDLVLAALARAHRSAAVEVDKQIPAGAGLGGGSADAAAVLRWAASDRPELLDPGRSVELGADVPFCVAGGRARVGGIGEVVEPLPFEDHTYTLLTPNIHCSTPAVYSRWDELGGPTGDNGNDLEPAAVDLIPELVEWRDRLGDATGQTPRLAGSGSTWFVEGEYPGDGRQVWRTIPVSDGHR